MAVVSSQFCKSEEVALVYRRGWRNEEVLDLTGRPLFKVKHPSFVWNRDHYIVDLTTNAPLVRLRPQMFLPVRGIWYGYHAQQDRMLFMLRSSSIFQISMSIDVFVGSDKEPGKNRQPDYQIKGHSFSRGIDIVRGHNQEQAKGGSLWGRTEYTISVAPGVDIAFVVSLIAIVHDKRSSSNASSTTV
ncbi:protein LURP-one-related 10 [Selaginella moellendorffii]|uniref:protein LURP-one-related 10 n=1 Tax=Selaginella moellendorffii TaxID=88036 RepID=UPI000D1C3E28|nr:protein LURP-one-related 10 [Selaginella moellendorffii]|eukprot:XP_024532379.1 protein LURP-one-related 10 [Selaginella moellendorffii]